MKKIYPRTGDTQTVYLNTVVKDLSIEVGDYTIYNDFASNPLLFEQNNVLYHSLINHERLIISRYSGYPYSHVNIGMREYPNIQASILLMVHNSHLVGK